MSCSQVQSCLKKFQGTSPLNLVLIGWKLIFSEIIWFFRSLFGQWEIRQLEKRLKIENIRLAEAVDRVSGTKKVLNLSDPEVDIALGRVRLLKEEIKRLEFVRQARRQLFIEKRQHSYLKSRNQG